MGNMVKSLGGLSIINECILGEVIGPANTVMELSGGIVIIPFHLWIILKEMFEFGKFESSCFVWKGSG